MQKITVVVMLVVVFTGCLSVTTTHEIVPIGIGEEKAAGTAKKTHEDFVGLCSDKNSVFWKLPIKEQRHISHLVFSNTR